MHWYGTLPKDTIAALKGKRQGERREQQTPQTTGRESENVRRKSESKLRQEPAYYPPKIFLA